MSKNPPNYSHHLSYLWFQTKPPVAVFAKRTQSTLCVAILHHQEAYHQTLSKWFQNYVLCSRKFYCKLCWQDFHQTSPFHQHCCIGSKNKQKCTFLEKLNLMCIPYTIRVYFVNPCIKKILLSRCRKVVHCVHMKINVATTYKKIGFALNFFCTFDL